MSNRSRIEEMKAMKRRQELFRKRVKKLLPIVVIVLCVIIFIVITVVIIKKTKAENNDIVEIPTVTSEILTEEDTSEEEKEEMVIPKYSAVRTDNTKILGEEVASENAIIIDLKTNTICGEKKSDSRIVPASMTKVLTVLVAAEQIENLDDNVTITQEMIDYSFKHDCSPAGFTEGEVVPVKDLFYGTVLPSGGEAAIGLAIYTAGSEEAFVKLMNDKLTELGLGETAHFTNCVGVYDENHYCTAYDMAMIMEAAISNDFCRKVLSAQTYTTSITPEHPEGILFSNWFLRRIEDKDCGGEVIGDKTGYVVQSGNCAVSYAAAADGTGYICVTANAYSNWKCIYDHVALYKEFIL